MKSFTATSPRTAGLMVSALMATLLSSASVSAAEVPDALLKAAQAEGRVDSVGMPDSWANWKDTWADLESKYSIAHSDTDMSSAEEVAKFKAEGENATADIGDVGCAIGAWYALGCFRFGGVVRHHVSFPVWVFFRFVIHAPA